MLFYVATASDNMNKTQDYVTAQNYSDAYSDRYASLSSFDVDSVGAISVQEALELIYTHVQDSTPAIVVGPDGELKIFVNDTGGWIYSSGGKPLGMKVDAQGNYYEGQISTNVGAIEKATEPIPTYQELYNYLSNNQQGDIKYAVNIDPDNSGTLRTILIKAIN